VLIYNGIQTACMDVPEQGGMIAMMIGMRFAAIV